MDLPRHFLSLLALLLPLPMALAAPPDKGWTITQLDSLPSARPYAVATGINMRGDVVGWSYVYDASINSNRGYAVLWQDGYTTNLGEGSAQAINDHGDIVGSVTGGVSIWKNGTWNALGLSGAPFAINKSDAVAGWALGGQSHAYLYDNGVLTDLGTLGGNDSAATSLNDKGQVVGYAKVAGNANYHAFLWQNGTMRDLGTLAGGFESRAHDINNHGVAVGEAWDASGNSLPFVYDGTMRRLFTAPGCCVVPHALNDRGDVVGTIDGNASFLYSDGVLTRLEQIAAVQADGWTQLIPNDINDRGWIVGMGRKGPLQPAATQEWKAFVLKPR